MFVDDNLLDRIEKLAMIHISPEKRNAFKEELSEIIANMDSLQEVDTSSIVLQKNEKTPMRQDTPELSGIREQILKQAAKAKDDYFIVPKVIDNWPIKSQISVYICIFYEDRIYGYLVYYDVFIWHEFK